MSRHQSIRDIAEVARGLGELAHEVVFVGGAAVPLMVRSAIAPTIRPTEDVDCVVRAESYPDYSKMGERLRQVGFEECREEAFERIGAAPAELRQFLSDCGRRLLARKDLEDLVSGCFAGDAISQASVLRAVTVFRKLAGVPNEL